MPNYIEIIRLYECSMSQRKISQAVGSSRNTVSRTIKIAKEKQLTYEMVRQWDSTQLQSLFSNAKNSKKESTLYEMPDFEALSKELVKPGVTLQLLWEEYVDQCRQNQQLYYRLTQFKKHFNTYLERHTFSHIIRHKAGETVQVDWAGSKIQWIDPDTGEIIKGALFVATLPFSGYAFALGCYHQKMSEWVRAHIEMYEYFNGVPTLLIPDNLKTGVLKHTQSELILNPTYEALSKHYHTIIVPTRVSRPRDKAAVENSVKQLTTHLIARMRHYQCFSLDEFNQLLMKELSRFNQKAFQKKPGSRQSLFEAYEQPVLQTLPSHSFEVCEYKPAKVYTNSHIMYAKHSYSVPYTLIGDTVQLKIYSERIEIYHNDQYITQHPTQYKLPGHYTTCTEHLPKESQHYGTWNSTRYIKWAGRIGPNVYTVISRLFEQGPEQQYYRRAHSILKMADTYSDQRLDKACHYALEQNSHPNYRQIKKIIDSRLLQSNRNTPESEEQSYLRGAEYYDKFSR